MLLRWEFEDLPFYARHGINERERAVGTCYLVSVEVTAEASEVEALRTDDLSDTVDYAILYQCIEKEMRTPRRLIEKVAYAIAYRLLKASALAEEVYVKIKKRIHRHQGADMQWGGCALRLQKRDISS